MALSGLGDFGLNRNLSFDKFTIEQLAGDLLPHPTLEQQIATGFHRCNTTTNEGGSITEEVAAMYAKDRVATTGTVWLGLTVGCATCHDHKFDPISQKEFYQFSAFFRNTTQKVMDGNVPDTPPVVVPPTKEDAPRWETLQHEIVEARNRARQYREGASEAFNAWLTAKPAAVQPLDDAPELAQLTPANTAEGVSPAEGPDPLTPALQFAARSTLDVAMPRTLDAAKPFSVAAWIYLPKTDDNVTLASQFTRNKNEDAHGESTGNGWTIGVNARVPSISLSGGKGSITMRGSNVERLKPGSWNHLAFTYDGSRGQNGLGIFVNGHAMTTEGAGGENVELKGEISNAAPLRIGPLAGGAVADFHIYDLALREEEAKVLASWGGIRPVLSKPAEELSAAERESLLLYYLNRADRGYRQLAGKVESLEAERRAIRRRAAVTLVMYEKTDSAPMAKVLFRGQYDQPREEVTPAVLSVLPPMTASMPRSRLGLAEWIVDPSNPLTARVTVNRFWQEIFGAGLVTTAEDLGSQGAPPSHAELLDWLAVEFRDSGDVKKLFRLLVTSATYRQAANVDESKLKADPENRLLSRGPRFRMDAEMIRDLPVRPAGAAAYQVNSRNKRSH